MFLQSPSEFGLVNINSVGCKIISRIFRGVGTWNCYLLQYKLGWVDIAFKGGSDFVRLVIIS